MKGGERTLHLYAKKAKEGLRILFFSLCPFLVFFLCFVLSLQPFWSGGVRPIVFLLQWIPLFFWLLYIPRFVPMWLLFVWGVGIDAVYGYPLGVHTIFLLMLSWVLSFYRRREWGWLCDWVVFGVMMFCYRVGSVWVLKWDRGLEFEGQEVLFSSLVVVLLYPLSLPFLGRIVRRVEEEVRVR